MKKGDRVKEYLENCGYLWQNPGYALVCSMCGDGEKDILLPKSI